MLSSMTEKRKNDKPKGLPRQRLIIVVSVLGVAFIAVLASLVFRSAVPSQPTGRIFYRTNIVYAIDMQTGERVEFLNRPEPLPEDLFQPEWEAPNGLWTASWSLASAASEIYRTRLSIWDIATGQMISEIGSLYATGGPVTWSPDSEFVIFSGYTEAVSPNTPKNAQLFQFHIQSKELKQLTNTPSTNHGNDCLTQWPISRLQRVSRRCISGDGHESSNPGHLGTDAR